MAMRLSILYRGPLSSCNYGCDYCPFAKHHETAAELARDRRALERFVDWVAAPRSQDDRIAILFTPWGEALTRRWYREALVQLDRGCPTSSGRRSRPTSRARSTGSPTATGSGSPSGPRFTPRKWTARPSLRDAGSSIGRGVRFSVGIVGLKEHLDEAQALRRELPPHVYLWINAYKREPDYYSSDELRHFEAIDPLFPINTVRHPSLGRSCRAGRSVIAVDGEGTIRRCHFIPEPIGNIYEPGFEAALVERPCTNDTCSCHIGYVHLDHLGLDRVFGPGILERIPIRSVR